MYKRQVLNSDEASGIIEKVSIKKRFDMIGLLMETYDKYRTAANASSYFEVCLLKMLDLAASTEQIVQVQQIQQQPIIQRQPEKVVEQQVNVSRETFVPKQETPKPQLFVPEDDPYEEEVQPAFFEPEPIMRKAPVHHENKNAQPIDDEYILCLLYTSSKS